MVFFDSDILIDFLRNDKRTIELIDKLRNEQKDISTTSITSFELLKGIPKISNMKKSEVIDFLNNFNIFHFNFESSRKAAEIFEQLKSNGEIIELTDIMIASIAITNNESLLTRNTKHFERIKELKLEKF